MIDALFFALGALAYLVWWSYRHTTDERDLQSLLKHRRARRCLARGGAVQRRTTAPPRNPALFDWEEHADQPPETADKPPHRGP